MVYTFKNRTLSQFASKEDQTVIHYYSCVFGVYKVFHCLDEFLFTLSRLKSLEIHTSTACLEYPLILQGRAFLAGSLQSGEKGVYIIHPCCWPTPKQVLDFSVIESVKMLFHARFWLMLLLTLATGSYGVSEGHKEQDNSWKVTPISGQSLPFVSHLCSGIRWSNGTVLNFSHLTDQWIC